MDMKKHLLLLLVILLSILSLQAQNESEKEVLTQLLHDFLEGVNEAEMHDRFWSEELIYTSSAGKRFGKSVIMEGLQKSEDPSNSESQTTYAAEEIQIKLYGPVAIVAFKLITKSGEEIVGSYFNSGTFHKEAGKWKVVNWQATKAQE